MSPIAGRSVIVTGAALGLGAAIARHLAGEGARLALLDYNGPALAETAAACGQPDAATVVDLSDAVATAGAIDAALARLGRIDVVIHNAAILDPKPLSAMTLSDFQRTTNVGLQAGFQLARAAWPGMARTGRGVFIFVSSRSGIEGFADETAYCATKHGLEGFSKSIALEGAEVGIHSMTVTPGMYMRTPMSERNYSAELKQKWVEPDRLAPAFAMMIAEPERFNGQRLNAWMLATGDGR
ncbi:MAG: SDR family NAD(P)-dependent oxidoreductase [Devosia sp.]